MVRLQRSFQAASTDAKLAMSSDPDDRQELRARRAQRSCQHAYYAYQPAKIDRPIHLIRSTAYVQRSDKRRHLDWAQLTTGELRIDVVPGEHDTLLLEPEVAEVAKIVAEILRRNRT